MALVKCRECENTVSTEAKKCPKCGIDNPAQKKDKSGMGCGTAIAIVVGVFIFGAIIESISSEKVIESPPPESNRNQKILEQFSRHDNRHYGLTALIKNAMNDPDSFEHIKTTYADKNDHLIIQMQFRGKNGFGAKVLNEVTAKAGLDGDIIEIIDPSQQNDYSTKKLTGWFVNEETNPTDDSKTVTIYTESETGKNRYGKNITFVIRCKSNKTDVFINWGDYLGLDDTSVLTRIDSKDARTEQWDLSTDSKATFRRRPIAFLKTMMPSEKLIAQTTPYRENQITAVFNTAGLNEVIEPLRKECQW